MTTTTLNALQEAFFDLSAAGSDETPRPAGFSAVVSDYSKGYVALVGGNHLHFVPTASGANSIVINGHSQDGTALPPKTVDFTVSDPPVPQADHFVLGGVTVAGQSIATPGNPGTDTVTGAV